ncbi:hypothetical protein [Streptomyces virginiae]
MYEADVDLTGPLADWNAHLSLVRDKAAPLPEPLAALLVEITELLTATTADAPVAALRAVGVLERIAARVGREAASALAEGGVSAEAVAIGLRTVSGWVPFHCAARRAGQWNAPRPLLPPTRPHQQARQPVAFRSLLLRDRRVFSDWLGRAQGGAVGVVVPYVIAAVLESKPPSGKPHDR